MPTETEIIERIHNLENTQGQAGVKLENLERWIHDINKTVKALDKKMLLATGAFLAIEFVFKYWR